MDNILSGYYNFINNKILFVIKSNNAKMSDYVIKILLISCHLILNDLININLKNITI